MKKKAILLARLPLASKAGIPKVNLVYCQHCTSDLKVLSPALSKDIYRLDKNKFQNETIYNSQLTLFNVPISFAFVFQTLKHAFLSDYANLIINIPDPIPQLILSIFGGLFKNKVVIWHANPSPPLDLLLKPLLFPSFLMANSIVFFTQSHVNSLLKSNPLLSIFSSKFRIIPFGISIPSSYQSTKTFPANQIKLVAVGRLVEYKGFQNLIESLLLLDGRYNLKIVGSGPLHNKLLLLIESLSLHSRIEIISNADDRMLYNIYKSSDIYVMSSINQAEAYGITQLEAMNHSLPIVNTPLNNGVNELAPDGITGICSDGFDARSIACAILKINHKNYSNFSANSKRLSSTIYSASSFANSIDALLI